MLKRESVLKDKGIQNHNGIEFEELPHVHKIYIIGLSSKIDFRDMW